MSMKTTAAAVLLAGALMAAPATVYADCGDPDQAPCTGPVPAVDQVLAILAKLTDADIPAADKADIVSPEFSSDEAESIDDHLRIMSRRGYGPYNFVVTNIQPAPDNLAGATYSIPLGPWIMPGPIVLVDQGAHWLITHDRAMGVLHSIWHSSFPKGLGPRWE